MVVILERGNPPFSRLTRYTNGHLIRTDHSIGRMTPIRFRESLRNWHDRKSMKYKSTTVKILKFGTPQTIAIIVLKIEKFDVVVLLFYVHGKHLKSCRDGQLT